MERTEEATDSQGIGRRTWLVGIFFVVVLVTITVISVALMGDHEDTVYDPASPEAVVQAYAEAWGTGDVDAAWTMLTPRAQERIHELEFRRAASWGEDRPTRVWIDERDDYDDRVVLALSIERTWDGLFGPDRDIQPLRLTLVQLDGTWRIDTPIAGFHPW